MIPNTLRALARSASNVTSVARTNVVDDLQRAPLGPDSPPQRGSHPLILFVDRRVPIVCADPE